MTIHKIFILEGEEEYRKVFASCTPSPYRGSWGGYRKEHKYILKWTGSVLSFIICWHLSIPTAFVSLWFNFDKFSWNSVLIISNLSFVMLGVGLFPYILSNNKITWLFDSFHKLLLYSFLHLVFSSFINFNLLFLHFFWL